MKYDPQQHHRRSIRLKGYDYTSPGAYFITICTHQRHCLFGEIVDGKMQLNELGKWVNACWKRLPTHFSHLQLDRFIVMPNHIHGILGLTHNPNEPEPANGRGAAFGRPSTQLSNIPRPNATPGSDQARSPFPHPDCALGLTHNSNEPEPANGRGAAFGRPSTQLSNIPRPNATPGLGQARSHSFDPDYANPTDPNATPGSGQARSPFPHPDCANPLANSNQPLMNESEPGVAFGREMGVKERASLPNAAPLRAGSVGAIVLNFKSVTARRINQMRKMTSVPVWQRNYYEHIIRDDVALANIQNYIDHNPLSWWQDQLHPDNPSKW